MSTTDVLLTWMEEDWMNRPTEAPKADEPSPDLEEHAPWNKGRV